MAQDENRKCPRCGAELPAGAAEGLCPACLLRRGLETNTVGYTASQGPASGWTPPEPEELSARFGELEIVELIGRGGMGAVYKARQRNLDRIVALKVLPPEIGRDKAFAERFAREAQAMARLGHPHIVAIYDFGQREGLYFFLMEYVDGLNLRQLLDAGHIAPREALAIVPQICDALQFAHDQGIVHRDIKPENILLDKRGQVKIADFGLAKLMGQMGLTAAVSSDKVMGTPHYMAPEQVEHPRDVDHRADIYSLGVVFYQMLTGELPLGRFEPPSHKVVIDVRLDEVVLRALEKEPSRRYQHASEVKTEVETIVTTPPGAQAPPRQEGPAGDTPLPPASVGKAADAATKVAQARGDVKAPAIAMLVMAIVNIALSMGAIVFCSLLAAKWSYAVDEARQSRAETEARIAAAYKAPAPEFRPGGEPGYVVEGQPPAGPPRFPAEPEGKAFISWFVIIVLVAVVLSLGLNVFIIWASVGMMRLRYHGAAVAAAILTMLGLVNLLALAAGIWALVVLSRREVKQAFALAKSSGKQSAAPPVGRNGWLAVAWTVALHGLLVAGVIVFFRYLLPAVIQTFAEAGIKLPTATQWSLVVLTTATRSWYIVLPVLLGLDTGICFLMQLIGPRARRAWSLTAIFGIAAASFFFLLAILLPYLSFVRAITNKPERRPAATRPADVRRFVSAAEIMASLPKEARPDSLGKWDGFSGPKADEWFRDNMSGRGYEFVTDAIVKKVALRRISPKDRLEETIRWDVDLTIERMPFEFNGRKLALKLDSFTPLDPNASTASLHMGDAVLEVSGNEAFARRAKALAPGEKVNVRGTIRKAAVWSRDPPELWILLEYNPTVALQSGAAPTTSEKLPATRPATEPASAS